MPSAHPVRTMGSLPQDGIPIDPEPTPRSPLRLFSCCMPALYAPGPVHQLPTLARRIPVRWMYAYTWMVLLTGSHLSGLSDSALRSLVGVGFS